MDSNENPNQRNKILKSGFDDKEKDENEFNYMLRNNNKILNQKDNESKDNLNPNSNKKNEENI